MSPDYHYYMNSPAWRSKAATTRSLTKQRCCVFPFLRATDAHHLSYRNFQREIPIWDTVPVSRLGHSILHFPLFWVYPVRFLVNGVLRFNVLLLALILRPLLMLAMIGLMLWGFFAYGNDVMRFMESVRHDALNSLHTLLPINR